MPGDVHRGIGNHVFGQETLGTCIYFAEIMEYMLPS